MTVKRFLFLKNMHAKYFLGMLAILTQSGLGLRKAILLDMVPAALSYLGFIVGALLQKSVSGASGYVYAVSSGMYLYVLLGCLVSICPQTLYFLPEINGNAFSSVFPRSVFFS